MPNIIFTFNDYLRQKYGVRVHRLSLDAGFGCPNRDGKKGAQGCIFCNEEGFSFYSGKNMPLVEQISTSMEFARKRFKAQKFIAYFQSGTNTYANTEDLKKAYDTIKGFPDIVGLFISTRPDCIDNEKLGLIQGYCRDYEVWVEYGLQTIHDKTLAFLTRRHSYEDFLKAVELTRGRDIKTAAHIILGLPGETKKDMLETAAAVSKLGLSGVKMHVFHILKDTRCEELYNKGQVKVLNFDEYTTLASDFLEVLDPGLVIMRLVSDADEKILVAPKWINEKPQVIAEIENILKKRGSYQGKNYAK